MYQIYVINLTALKKQLVQKFAILVVKVVFLSIQQSARFTINDKNGCLNCSNKQNLVILLGNIVFKGPAQCHYHVFGSAHNYD